VVDVAGQEIMTADKVTLRQNAVVTFKVADPLKAVPAVGGPSPGPLPRGQLALRAVVGTRELGRPLSDKARSRRSSTASSAAARRVGVEVVALGIRDVILPADED
jgi:regulator of protease activity HflC (stomatin/prohibitin superfamily)